VIVVTDDSASGDCAGGVADLVGPATETEVSSGYQTASAARRALLWDLRFAGEYADREDLPRRDGMTAPGTGVDAAGNLVAWAYDPQDRETVIEVREKRSATGGP
jgi:hypothetical protein